MVTCGSISEWTFLLFEYVLQSQLDTNYASCRISLHVIALLRFNSHALLLPPAQGRRDGFSPSSKGASGGYNNIWS